MLTIFTTPEGAGRALGRELLHELTEAERKGWEWLVTRGKSKSSQYAAAFKVDDRTARRHLNHFAELNMVRRTGSGRATVYEVM